MQSQGKTLHGIQAITSFFMLFQFHNLRPGVPQARVKRVSRLGSRQLRKQLDAACSSEPERSSKHQAKKSAQCLLWKRAAAAVEKVRKDIRCKVKGRLYMAYKQLQDITSFFILFQFHNLRPGVPQARVKRVSRLGSR